MSGNESDDFCICGNHYLCEAPADGPQNSDIPTECTHWLCTDCWTKRQANSLLNCPLCGRDISEWLSKYPLDDTDDEL